MTDISCSLPANEKDRFEWASMTINTEIYNSEQIETNKRWILITLTSYSAYLNNKTYSILKTNNTENESINNNDPLGGSLFENDSMDGGNNTIQESLWEESQQSITGYNSSRVNLKGSERVYHRENSLPKIGTKANKRIKVWLRLS